MIAQNVESLHTDVIRRGVVSGVTVEVDDPRHLLRSVAHGLNSTLKSVHQEFHVPNIVNGVLLSGAHVNYRSSHFVRTTTEHLSRTGLLVEIISSDELRLVLLSPSESSTKKLVGFFSHPNHERVNNVVNKLRHRTCAPWGSILSSPIF